MCPKRHAGRAGLPVRSRRSRPCAAHAPRLDKLYATGLEMRSHHPPPPPSRSKSLPLLQTDREVIFFCLRDVQFLGIVFFFTAAGVARCTCAHRRQEGRSITVPSPDPNRIIAQWARAGRSGVKWRRIFYVGKNLQVCDLSCP